MTAKLEDVTAKIMAGENAWATEFIKQNPKDETVHSEELWKVLKKRALSSSLENSKYFLLKFYESVEISKSFRNNKFEKFLTSFL